MSAAAFFMFWSKSSHFSDSAADLANRRSREALAASPALATAGRIARRANATAPINPKLVTLMECSFAHTTRVKN
jgi:hypothetical protein